MNPSEKTIKTAEVQVERKKFRFELKENDRGRFLRVTEDANGHRDTIIIPAPGLEDFRRCLLAMETADTSSSS